MNSLRYSFGIDRYKGDGNNLPQTKSKFTNDNDPTMHSETNKISSIFPKPKSMLEMR